MKNKNRLKLASAIAVSTLIAILQAPGAIAASGTTSVSVDFPEIIILHYRSKLNIRFTGGANNAVDEGSAGTISLPLNTASGDGTLSVTGTANTIIPVKVANMWAVRGITSSGNFQIDASITNDTASLANSSVVMDKLEAVASGAAGQSITVPSSGLAPANAVTGGITFQLDIEDVKQTGTHTGIEYTITASAP
jgi:hypothetical protein